MTSENAQQLLQRILATSLNKRPNKRWSHVALFKEYARRMALWAVRLKRASDWLFFDVAGALDPQWRADESLVSALHDFLDDKAYLGLMCDVYEWALHWAALRESQSFDLPDPYEPIILLYERGGNVRQYRADIWAVSDTFGVSGVTLSYYAGLPTVVDLDEQTLNLLDNEESSID